ncbi:DUF2946 family protein [Luteimonas changyuni]|uniref:DUF2946 family protein n=1 Tax=Luteimonas sp. MJ145 TaxID=3129234 RepID=UPI0031BB521B
MNTKGFQHWMGRIGLAAALLLMLVPTTTRLLDAPGEARVAQAPVHDGGHARHRGHDGGAPGDARPAIGDPDCDYCPLLAAFTHSAPVVFKAFALPLPTPPALAPTAPSVAWLHPNGLGSRGPPRVG